MPEPRDWYDAPAVSRRIIQPSFAALAERGRRRAHRTRAVRMAGVAVAAALVTTPLLALPGEQGPGRPGSPPTGAEVTGTQPGRSFAHGVEFFDIDHGVAYYYPVEVPSGKPCGAVVSVTGDRGQTWSRWRELPQFPNQRAVEDRTACLPVRVVPVAPETLLIPIDAEVASFFADAGFDPPATSFVSHDAGRTWQAYEPRVTTADVVPEGVDPEVGCAAGTGCLDQLYWYDPQTGDRMVARNTPPALEGMLAGHGEVAVAADASIWVTALAPDGDYHVSVSHDRGRTWTDRSPAHVADVDEFPFGRAVTYDGTTGYFYWGLSIAEGPGNPVHLYRTTDGGETWHPLPAEVPFDGEPRGIWVAADGLVMVDAAGNGYLSPDGAEAFQEVEQDLPWNVHPIRGGFHTNSLDLYTDAVSEDGLTWRGLELPTPP